MAMNSLDRVESGIQSHPVDDKSPDDCVAQLVGVTRTFAGTPDVQAVKECFLDIQRGDFLTVIGPSGSGKSSLLNLLGLLDRPTSGTYLLEGHDTSTMTDRERTYVRGRTLGFVFQAFHLLGHRSALENVQMSMIYRRMSDGVRRRRAAEALEAVGLAHRAQFLPTRLSGGERQRVAIARALAGRPSMLLCDEPTGNLDSASSAAVLDLFRILNEAGTTVVLITHDADVAARGNRMISVRDGVVTDRG